MAFAPKKAFSKTYQQQLVDLHLGDLQSPDRRVRDKAAWGLEELAKTELGMSRILEKKRDVVSALVEAMGRDNLDTAKLGVANALREIAASDVEARKQAVIALKGQVPALLERMREPEDWKAGSDLQKIAHVCSELRKEVVSGALKLVDGNAGEKAKKAAKRLIERIAQGEETAQDRQDEISRYIR